MDPFTAIAILGAHLLCSGALFIGLVGRVRSLRFASERGVTLGRTVSVGISATVFSFADRAATRRQADQALSRARSDGRNRRVRFGDPVAAVAG